MAVTLTSEGSDVCGADSVPKKNALSSGTLLEGGHSESGQLGQQNGGSNGGLHQEEDLAAANCYMPNNVNKMAFAVGNGDGGLSIHVASSILGEEAGLMTDGNGAGVADAQKTRKLACAEGDMEMVTVLQRAQTVEDEDEHDCLCPDGYLCRPGNRCAVYQVFAKGSSSANDSCESSSSNCCDCSTTQSWECPGNGDVDYRVHQLPRANANHGPSGSVTDCTVVDMSSIDEERQPAPMLPWTRRYDGARDDACVVTQSNGQGLPIPSISTLKGIMHLHRLGDGNSLELGLRGTSPTRASASGSSCALYSKSNEGSKRLHNSKLRRQRQQPPATVKAIDLPGNIGHKPIDDLVSFVNNGPRASKLSSAGATSAQKKERKATKSVSAPATSITAAAAPLSADKSPPATGKAVAADNGCKASSVQKQGDGRSRATASRSRPTTGAGLPGSAATPVSPIAAHSDESFSLVLRKKKKAVSAGHGQPVVHSGMLGLPENPVLPNLSSGICASLPPRVKAEGACLDDRAPGTKSRHGSAGGAQPAECPPNAGAGTHNCDLESGKPTPLESAKALRPEAVKPVPPEAAALLAHPSSELLKKTWAVVAAGGVGGCIKGRRVAESSAAPTESDSSRTAENSPVDLDSRQSSDNGSNPCVTVSLCEPPSMPDGTTKPRDCSGAPVLQAVQLSGDRACSVEAAVFASQVASGEHCKANDDLPQGAQTARCLRGLEFVGVQRKAFLSPTCATVTFGSFDIDKELESDFVAESALRSNGCTAAAVANGLEKPAVPAVADVDDNHTASCGGAASDCVVADVKPSHGLVPELDSSVSSATSDDTVQVVIAPAVDPAVHGGGRGCRLVLARMGPGCDVDDPTITLYCRPVVVCMQRGAAGLSAGSAAGHEALPAEEAHVQDVNFLLQEWDAVRALLLKDPSAVVVYNGD